MSGTCRRALADAQTVYTRIEGTQAGERGAGREAGVAGRKVAVGQRERRGVWRPAAPCRALIPEHMCGVQLHVSQVGVWNRCDCSSDQQRGIERGGSCRRRRCCCCCRGQQAPPSVGRCWVRQEAVQRGALGHHAIHQLRDQALAGATCVSGCSGGRAGCEEQAHVHRRHAGIRHDDPVAEAGGQVLDCGGRLQRPEVALAAHQALPRQRISPVAGPHAAGSPVRLATTNIQEGTRL